MKIAVEDLTAFISVVAGAITGVLIISKFLNGLMTKWASTLIEPIDQKIDQSNREIKGLIEQNSEDVKQMKLDLCKNLLTRYLSDIERGTKLTEIELERFNDINSNYIKLGGNSYIHSKIDKYKAQGKL
ncbi:hypothetical protein HG463_002160 [Candidatus Saccharibacteria bacterium]|nr:hypothetical protein [Candidatus Saccharibacteria bacterium]DAM36306.1 MAG TPA: hypothetical protein [Caudoviricetes sp.]